MLDTNQDLSFKPVATARRGFHRGRHSPLQSRRFHPAVRCLFGRRNGRYAHLPGPVDARLGGKGRVRHQLLSGQAAVRPLGYRHGCAHSRPCPGSDRAEYPVLGHGDPFKQPHDPKAVPWHQDASFWSLRPARTVTVWLAIDDADAENAAMRFLFLALHDKGPLAVQSTGAEAVFHKQTVGADSLGVPFTNELRAGQISCMPTCWCTARLPMTCPATLRTDFTLLSAGGRDHGRRRARGVEWPVPRRCGRMEDAPAPANDDITRTSSPHVVQRKCRAQGSRPLIIKCIRRQRENG